MEFNAEYIKSIRKRKGLTQKQLGELSGINPAQIRRYESGKGNPKIESLSKIARALNVPIDAIVPSLSREYISQQLTETSSEDYQLTHLIEFMEASGFTVSFGDEIEPTDSPTYEGKPISEFPENEKPEPSEYDHYFNKIYIENISANLFDGPIAVPQEALDHIVEDILNYIEFTFWKHRSIE